MAKILLRGDIPKKEERIMRLCWNDKNWELPVPHSWKKKNQRKNNIAFENQFGFGHEEWLFNLRYNVKGYQYGYIRGISKLGEDTSFVDRIYLYTIKHNGNKKAVYYVGYIDNVNVLKENEKDEIDSTIKKYSLDQSQEVENIAGDIKGLRGKRYKFHTCIKFKLKDAHILDVFIFQPKFDKRRFPRFQPYQIKQGINRIFNLDDTDNDNLFIAGKAKQTEIYNRESSTSKKQISKFHTEIVNELEKFLKPEFSLSKKNLSIEKTRFDRNIADVVTLEKKNQIIIYEVKTSSSGRKNIREAISQLLDYASHNTKYKIKEIVIVSPNLQDKEIHFLKSLREMISIKLNCLCYDKDSNRKFIVK